MAEVLQALPAGTLLWSQPKGIPRSVNVQPRARSAMTVASTTVSNSTPASSFAPPPLPPSLSPLDNVRTQPQKAPANQLSVNENGSFECDRVLKSGTVLKRTRKTKVCFFDPKPVVFFSDSSKLRE